MKKSISFFALFILILSFSQSSKIYPKNKIVLGEDNIFVYEPAKGIAVPDDAFANYTFLGGIKKSTFRKVSNKYEFAVKVPDSIRTLIMVFKNPKETFVDNNSDKGFVYYLKNSNDGKSQIDRLNNILNLGIYFLKLNYSNENLVAEYQYLFKKYPDLKNENYGYYLNLLGKTNPETAKIEFKEYAEAQEKLGTEKGLIKSYNIYLYSLKDNDKADTISKAILEKYPNGIFAKRQFYRIFFDNLKDTSKKIDENAILQFISDFQNKFPKDQYDNQMVDQMKMQLLKIAIDEKNWEKIEKYTNLFSNKIYASNSFNQHAWQNADGDNLNSAGKDLDFAEKLSRKSLEIIQNKMDNLGKYEDLSDFESGYNQFADTLALILFKEKKYQEAFDYQDAIEKSMKQQDVRGMERFVAYAEKIKDQNFVKNYIYKLLKEQDISDNLYNKLSDIYKSENLSTIEIENLRIENKKIATKKAKQELLKFYGGDIKAKDFTLTNLEGKTVKLSDYKGKIVVLDFWATWCGPCRASLPHMQELVNKYKDSDVNFFFVNTMENKKPTEIKKDVSKFLLDNKYNLNVLFDYQDDVSKKYKVQGIPCEIIIGKDGNIMSRSIGYDGNLEALIKENL